MTKERLAFFWFRRDLRLQDNAGFFHALKSGLNVQCVFIFDTDILDKLSSKSDKRLQFIYDEVSHLSKELKQHGSALLVRKGKPLEVWKDLANQYDMAEIYANRDYEPYAIRRDKEIYNWCQEINISFRAFKDQVIFDKREVVKKDGSPYLVFTPYMKQWKAKFTDYYGTSYPVNKYFNRLYQTNQEEILSLSDLGFETVDADIPSRDFTELNLDQYANKRDIPAANGTSRLSVHLRFGTVSIRKLVRYAVATNEKFLNELIWREFYMMILYHFPESVLKAIKPQYDRIEWENDETQFSAWCKGQTGIPLVDAGMRELNQTGYMHNRVRMVVASFLTKNLLIDWRWGEAYFAEKLLDYEQSSNVGGWQWAAGSGCDAAPYFRVFNPVTQQEKFDPNYRYIKTWIPEWGTANYPQPMVDLKSTRVRAIERYKKALQKS